MNKWLKVPLFPESQFQEHILLSIRNRRKNNRMFRACPEMGGMSLAKFEENGEGI